MSRKRVRVPAVMLLYLGMVILINFLSFILPDTEFSSFENRTMAYMPGPKMNTILSGQWFADFENYHLDQIAGRNLLIEWDSKMQYMLGRREINGIEIGKEHYLLKKEEDFIRKDLNASEKSIQRQLDTLRLIKEYTDFYGGELYYLDIPSHEEFLWEQYRLPQEDKHLHNQRAREVRRQRYEEAGINVIMTNDALDSHRSEELYYHTDHHYTFLGAYYVYQEILNHVKVKYPDHKFAYPEWDEMECVSSDKIFMGGYIHKIGDRKYTKYDTFQYALPKDFPVYERYESGVLSDMPLVRKIEDYDYTEYGYFMNGDNAQTVIKTLRSELPSILFIGYSFTNPLELMAVYNFDEVHSIDPRHFKGSICKYIEENPCEIVVVVRNDIYEGNKEDRATFKE